ETHPEQVSEVVHGTTLVTNTIIERNGAKVGLIVTKGTRDALDIAREVRYDLYDLNLELPQPLVPPRLRHEADERLDAQGEVLTKLDEKEVAGLVDKLKKQGVDAIAVCLLHAYVNDVHEKKIKQIIRKQLPGVSVSISSEVAREIREYERMSTTTANAFVQPLMEKYLARLEGRMREIKVPGPLRIMVSSGGFTSSKAAADVPILLLESGPAGGVLSAVNTGLQNKVKDVLAFDMGGTTAKACVSVGGEPALAHSFEAGRVHRFKKGSGLPILIPSIDLIEIGAGGGSIAHVNQLGLLNVGPQSSGAVPGPACYDQGGKDATVTDACLALGYLDPDNFLGGEMKLRTDLATRALDSLAGKLGMKTNEVAYGIYNVVCENMAAAARVHIAEKGLDPRTFTMVATGGAGPLHAVEVASKLQIKRVMCTIAAGAGSCLGLLAAPARVDRSWSKVSLIDDISWIEVKSVLGRLHKEANDELGSAGARGEKITWMIGIEVRYAGQGNTVQVDLPYKNVGPALGKKLVEQFEERYRQLYGQTVPNAVPQVVTWRLTGSSDVKMREFKLADRRNMPDAKKKVAPMGKRPVWLPEKSKFGDVPVYQRYSLPGGTKLKGPLILQERESTVIVARPATVEILKNLTVSVTLK
ncbi:MAG: hydantoinase/oxoprolinase family protein, partial [Acetobacterales bacterium]